LNLYTVLPSYGIPNYIVETSSVILKNSIDYLLKGSLLISVSEYQLNDLMSTYRFLTIDGGVYVLCYCPKFNDPGQGHLILMPEDFSKEPSPLESLLEYYFYGGPCRYKVKDQLLNLKRYELIEFIKMFIERNQSFNQMILQPYSHTVFLQDLIDFLKLKDS